MSTLLKVPTLCVVGIVLSASWLLLGSLQAQVAPPASNPAAVSRPVVPASGSAPLDENTSAARWSADIAEFEAWDRKNTPPADAVLFVGSSTMVRWNSARDFPQYAIINRGFGGSQFSDLTHYAHRVVTPYKPRAIVIYSGDNDIAAGLSAVQVSDAVAALIARIRRDLPGTPVLIFSIKPSVARWSLWPVMQAANRLIAEQCRTGRNLTYVDITGVMLDSEGRPRADRLVDDGLHLSAFGYAAWNDVLRPALHRILDP